MIHLECPAALSYTLFMKLKILTIIISLLTLIFLGLIYAWSIFVVPLENEFGWSRSETSLTFTISIMAFCLSMMFGGFFNGKKDKPLISLIIAAVLIAAGFVMTSRAGSLLGFYICYGVCCGAGVGFSYVEIISVISKWFPARQGLMSGTMMMAYGMGAMILGPICTALMGSIGWRSVFVLLGVIMSLLLALSGILMQTANALAPAAKASDPELDPDLNETSSEQLSPQISSNDKSPAQAVRTLEFWILFFFCMVLSASGLALMGHIAPCVMGMGVSAQSAALIAGITSFANGFGRIVYGTGYDKLGIRRNMFLASTIFLLATIVTAAGIRTEILPVLIAGCFLLGLSFGAAPPTSSTAVARTFGNKYFSANFGLSSSQLIFAAFIGPYLGGVVYTATGSYAVTFSCFIPFGVLAVIFALIMGRRASV